MDALSEVLRLIRLQGALFLHGRFHEPWCVDAPRGADMAPVLCPGAPQLAILHLVLEGRCWIRLRSGGEPVELRRGDVALLPGGAAHLIGSGTGHAPVELQHAVPVKLPELAPVRYGGDGEMTLLACGWFAYESGGPNPLLDALPPLLHVVLGNRPAGAWVEQSVRYALQEAAAGQPGSSVIAAKVAESMFVETLRAYLECLPAQESGWLAGVRDANVGRCLALMHAQPGRDWTLQALAREAHVSRSVLAQRFSELLGMPPMQYLKRWRLASAARMLNGERANIGQIAQAVGYESEASFSRAFKSEFGMPPGSWRNAGRARMGDLQ